MSKESYARGFVKAAAAAGVDPTELAKFAQQYKTDGYVPSLNPDSAPATYPSKDHENWIDIPYIYSSSFGSKTPPLGNLLAVGGSYDSGAYPERRLRAELDQRLANWIAAHTNASAKARAPLARANYPMNRKIPKDIGDMIAKIYHDEMKRTTSAPPVQVSAPEKK